MKIRTDFVTNSSSTSYCIMGIDFSSIEIDPGDMEMAEKLENEGIAIDSCYEPYVIGLDICKMRDTETLGQFKSRVMQELNKISDNNEIAGGKISLHYGESYD